MMHEARAYIESINVNPDGGVPKHPVPAAEITQDRAGGVAVSSELIAALHGEGHAIVPGSVGENLTIRGLPWSRLHTGDRLTIGSGLNSRLQGTRHPVRRSPGCSPTAGSFVSARRCTLGGADSTLASSVRA